MLCAGTFINRFGSFVVPFLVLHLTRLGHSPARAGFAVAAYGTGHLIASIVGGYLADRIGRRKTIAFSMFAGAGAMLALSQAHDFEMIVGLTALLGLASEMHRPAASALIVDLVPVEQRVTAFALFRLSINAGFAFGPATAGFLAEKSFVWLFWGDALTSAVFGVIALIALPRGIRNASAISHWAEELKTVCADRRLIVFLTAVFPATVVFFQMTSSLALHVKSVGLSSAAYGMLISLNGLIIILFELPLTAYTQRLPARPVIAAGYFLTGLGYAVTYFARDAWTLAGTVMIWTLGEMFSAPVATAYIASLAPENLRGRYMGLFSFTWSLGLMTGPALGTAMFANSPGQLFLLCGALGTISALMVLASARK